MSPARLPQRAPIARREIGPSRVARAGLERQAARPFVCHPFARRGECVHYAPRGAPRCVAVASAAAVTAFAAVATI